MQEIRQAREIRRALGIPIGVRSFHVWRDCANSSSGYLQDQPQRKGSSGFWTVEYYQSYFDVDTKTVRQQHPWFISSCPMIPSGAPTVLFDPSSNFVIELPFHASQSRRSIRPILDINHVDLHSFPLVESGRIHLCVSLCSGCGIRL